MILIIYHQTRFYLILNILRQYQCHINNFFKYCRRIRRLTVFIFLTQLSLVKWVMLMSTFKISFIDVSSLKKIFYLTFFNFLFLLRQLKEVFGYVRGLLCTRVDEGYKCSKNYLLTIGRNYKKEIKGLLSDQFFI